MTAKMADRIATVLFVLIALIIVLLLAGLLGYILVKGLAVINWKFITTPPKFMQAGGGVGPQLYNSIYLLILTTIITTPVGMGAGIYLAEYAKPGRLTHFLRTSIEILSSLPSIVVGLFGLLLFVNYTGWGYTLMGGALALSIFNLPLMVRITEDAISAVPREQKEAALALGLTHWTTITKVLIPSALPGIITGTILASGRVFGEAAALLYTSGMSTPALDFSNWNPFSPDSPLNPFRPGETLAVNIWKINSEGLVPDVKEIASGASALLVLAILAFNLLARALGSFLYRKMTSVK
ncbi:phosphate ABC transporter permease PstA [Thermicanus aegyptius]|uniref:phosphate ABC transporter permease PstA n=1 Tax=Thermicanus aegyptius TaxID=94009 RepID=UPI00041A8069|nr:phosphate ABC transporter permease PstA [Thermicanus aegyptius]